jgi:hypothetical protein
MILKGSRRACQNRGGGARWAEGEFGALAAAAGLGVIFLALALALVAVVRFQRRRSSSHIEPQAVHDRAAAAAVEGLRLLGPRSVFPALALSAVILAATQGVPRSKSKPEAAE